MTEEGSNPEGGLWRMSYWSRDPAGSTMKSGEEEVQSRQRRGAPRKRQVSSVAAVWEAHRLV